MANIDYKNTRLIAHRGLSSKEVENTLPAFLLACQEPRVYGVECDVQVTKDGQFVVFHDRNLKRMCGLDDKIKNKTLAQLQNIPIYDKNRQLSKKYHIPTFSEYLDLIATYGKIAVIEIKSKMTKTQIKRLYSEIRQKLDPKRVVIISFYTKCLLQMRWIDKNIALQHICEYKFKRRTLLCRTHNIGLDYHYHLMTTKALAYYKKHNMVTNVWTVDDKQSFVKYVNAGVDYVTSNVVF